MEELIKNIFNRYGYSLSDKQINQFAVYYQFLVEENKKYNLTAITEPRDVVVKHFVDSVLPEKDIKQGATVLDVGTGAGFPGVPLKILRPDIKLTLLDSLQKRINFLNQLLLKLNIADVVTVHARAEDYIKNKRESFDIALSRAVAQIPTLAEYLLPYVKLGGKVIMYKGNKLEEELRLGQNAIKTLGGKVEKIERFGLDEVESERLVLVIDKIKSADKKYPRAKNLPKIKPIL